MTVEQLYKDHIQLIKNRAYRWSRPGVIGSEFQDLFSIGNEVFLNCCTKWDSERGEFKTFLYASLQTTFYDECIAKPNCNKYAHPAQNNEEIETLYLDVYNPETYTIFRDRLEKKLSPKAKTIVNTALETPPAMIDHMIEETDYARVSKRRIKRYLCEVEAWTIYAVNKGFREIKQAMRA